MVMKGKKSALLFLVVSFLFISGVASAQTKFTLNKEGVGCLKKGMLFTKIPAKCEGLYDRFEKQAVEDEMDGDYIIYNFYLGTEKVVDITNYGDTKINYITVYSANVSTPDGVSPGMPIKKLLAIKGVQGLYNDGIALGLNGYTIGFDGMSTIGDKAFNDAYAKGTDVKLTAACFKANAKVLSVSY